MLLTLVQNWNLPSSQFLLLWESFGLCFFSDFDVSDSIVSCIVYAAFVWIRLRLFILESKTNFQDFHYQETWMFENKNRNEK